MTDTQIDKKWIEAHIPHQGKMCLLDDVMSWSEQSITCTATSHLLESNPLRFNGGLSTACGIEYAAQAMAVHGALLASNKQSRPRAGFLLSVRGAKIHRQHLHDLKQALTIIVECINKSEDNLLYAFTVLAENTLLLEGRAVVLTNTDSLSGSSL